MIITFMRKLSTSRFVFLTTLVILPQVVSILRGRFGSGRFTYRVYSITPTDLSARAAKAAHRTAKSVHDPVTATLHQIMAYRFDFDLGQNLSQWESRTEQTLTFCDRALENNVPKGDVAELILGALSLVFHPSIHQGMIPSPIVDSPDVTEVLLSHKCLQVIRGEDSDAGQAKNKRSRGTKIGTAGTRLLVLTDTNFNFMGTIFDHWKSKTGVSLRVRNLVSEGVDSEWWNLRNTILDRLIGETPTPPDFLAADLEWADVVYVEWSQALAARLSGLDFPGRLVVRLHRYEAFIAPPTLTNWNNVDELIIITPYMQEVLDRIVPGIETRTSICFIPNVVDLSRHNQQKLLEASRTLALVQYGSTVKDPMWALDVLDLLHQDDRSWRILLVGAAGPRAECDDATKRYFVDFDRRASNFGDSVQRLGQRNDLPTVFQQVGVIMSSSRLEGSPVSLQEGIASGAFPVVRNWPMAKAVGGAVRLYPLEWIVETPEEAAQRILSWAPPIGAAVDEVESRTWITEKFDASVIAHRFDRVVLG